MRQNLDQSGALLHWAILVQKDTRRGEESISEKGQQEDLVLLLLEVGLASTRLKKEFKPWNPNNVKIKAASRRKE